MTGVEEIADELYGLPPDKFTAARTRFEKEAKTAGDRDTVARIHALAKPTVTAWLANQLSRERRDELKSLLELGAELRNATRNLAGDQLRALSRQRNELVNALVQQARQLARATGRSVTEDAARALADTLQAGLADEEAAKVLLAGRLTEALHSAEFGTGFGSASGAGSDRDASNVVPIRRPEGGAGKRAGAAPGAAVDLQRDAADRELAGAERALADAMAVRDEAASQAAEADRAATAAHELVDELRQRIDEANRAASDADRGRRERAGALRLAERSVGGAERRRDDARDHRDRL